MGPEEVISNKTVVFFDGTCNLCNSFVQFVIRHERHAELHFAPLQSELGHYAQDLAKSAQQEDLDSLILWRKGQILTKSSAALEIAGHLRFPYRPLRHLKVLPRVLRDSIYELVAARRYRWFGQRDSCMVPTPALAERFL